MTSTILSGICLGWFYLSVMVTYFEAKYNHENKRKIRATLFIWPAVNLTLFWIIYHL